MRMLRKARGMTQKALADEVGTTAGVVRNIEFGCYASIARLHQIAAALGTDLLDILKPGTDMHEVVRALTHGNGDSDPERAA